MFKHYLLASDFDQTLSFNDSGVVLSELIGFHGFRDKVAGLAQMNLVQQGAELSYLIVHDPDFRRVRRADRVAPPCIAIRSGAPHARFGGQAGNEGVRAERVPGDEDRTVRRGGSVDPAQLQPER